MTGVIRRSIVTGLTLAVTAGCGDAFTANVSVVAHAGAVPLGVAELATLLGSTNSMPLRKDVLDRVVHRWIEYSLFAQRIGAGDSLTDSLTVARAMWPDLSQARVDSLHEQLVATRVRTDTATIDSVYQAGTLRVVYHILLRTSADMKPEQRDRALARAQEARHKLQQGVRWERVNDEYNEDPAAKRAGGSLGPVYRNELAAAFGDAAFALQPGALSDVVETPYGYHIIWRPRLEEVRDQFEKRAKLELVAQMDSVFLAELSRTWRIKLTSSAPAHAREAAEAPLDFRDSKTVLGTYRGGSFTVSNFVQWLQMVPRPTRQRAMTSGDDATRDFLRSLMVNEVLVKEAIAANVPVPEAAYQDARQRFVDDVTTLRQALGLDSALADATRGPDSLARAARAADHYLARMVRSLRGIVIVPPFLAGALLEDAEWSVSSAGLDRVIQQASALRGAARGPAADTVTPWVPETPR